MLTTVLIGPAAVGKSTIGAILAQITNREFVDVDEIGDRYYSAAGQPLDLFARRIEADGFSQAHRWWQPARVRALDVVADHRGAVIALGARWSTPINYRRETSQVVLPVDCARHHRSDSSCDVDSCRAERFRADRPSTDVPRASGLVVDVNGSIRAMTGASAAALRAGDRIRFNSPLFDPAGGLGVRPQGFAGFGGPAVWFAPAGNRAVDSTRWSGRACASCVGGLGRQWWFRDRGRLRCVLSKGATEDGRGVAGADGCSRGRS